ncbi:MAG: hypothetical protein DBW99_04005 [SAR86 cluster bacterium]|jgi:hypothetical protein|nr:hypothetical protein [Gammaproteobacteria bacterium]RCL35507.1 MAG: hypothetical protein DBW99_04005 [SAR86 cluster bacterium]|tara:strand:- start:2329 stop:3477 length:1149 start_codon:yes stop_codon:yes gene_type:complete
MKTILINQLSDSFDKFLIVTQNNGDIKKNTVSDVSSLYEQKDIEKIFYSIPSNYITAYPFNFNEKISKQINIANFVTEIDSFVIEDISNCEFLFFNSIGFVIDKSILNKINNLLSKFSSDIQLLPEFFLSPYQGKDAIIEFEEKYIFTFADGTGSAADEKSLDQYLDIILNNNPGFNPLICSDKKLLKNRFESENLKSLYNIENFFKFNSSSLPNFFKLQLSFELVKEKLNFTKNQLIAATLSLLITLSIPSAIIAISNNYAKTYNEETFNIFKSLDKNVKRVVNPKGQIDELIGNINTKPVGEYEIPNLNIIDRLGSQFIDEIEINIIESNAKIQINAMAYLQFEALKNTSPRLGIFILEDNTTIQNNKVSGSIKVSFSND